jgi:hypothetical protein
MHLRALPVTIRDALLKIGLTKQYSMYHAIMPAYSHDNVIIPNEPTPKTRWA